MMTNVIANYNTTNYYIPLPYIANRVVDDLSRIVSAFVTIDSLLATKADSSLIGTLNGLATLDSNGRLTSSQFPALTGDVTSNAGSTTLALSDTGVVAGTYNSVTVDAKGRVISASVVSTTPNVSSDFTTTLNTLSLSDTGVVAGTYSSVTVDAKGRITNGTIPANDPSQTQAKTLQWVGNVTSMIGNNRWYPFKPVTIIGAYMSINTAPTSSITATINKNGVAIGTVTLLAGAYISTTTGLLTSMTVDDYILVDIAGTSGANASLTITYI
jgi:phage-related tail fiber protein